MLRLQKKMGLPFFARRSEFMTRGYISSDEGMRDFRAVEARPTRRVHLPLRKPWMTAL